MTTRTLETDYLVIGCGAAGLAFTDALIADSDADVVMVDRRHTPGGHWNDAYPFVRLHQPSAYYGVNSLPLGSETIDRHGSNRGLYERASGPEICAYFDRVMQQHLLPSGRVRYFPMCEYVGEHRFFSRVSGDEHEVKVRKKHVDATYFEPSVPATCSPPFDVATGARSVPVNGLAQITQRPRCNPQMIPPFWLETRNAVLSAMAQPRGVDGHIRHMHYTGFRWLWATGRVVMINNAVDQSTSAMSLAEDMGSSTTLLNFKVIAGDSGNCTSENRIWVLSALERSNLKFSESGRRGPKSMKMQREAIAICRYQFSFANNFIIAAESSPTLNGFCKKPWHPWSKIACML